MIRLSIVLALLVAFGGPVAAEDTAKPTVKYIGKATMADDRSITMLLLLTSDGQHVNGQFTYRPGDKDYDAVLRHLGGLSPGETKPVTPWPD